jgi:hypothetical protein
MESLPTVCIWLQTPSSNDAHEDMRRSRKADEFEVTGVADRLTPYSISRPDSVERHDEVGVDDELLEKAVTLLRFAPRNLRRETVEKLLAPHDPQRGRRVVDALIGAALATEDSYGRLRRAARDT